MDPIIGIGGAVTGVVAVVAVVVMAFTVRSVMEARVKDADKRVSDAEENAKVVAGLEKERDDLARANGRLADEAAALRTLVASTADAALKGDHKEVEHAKNLAKFGAPSAVLAAALERAGRLPTANSEVPSVPTTPGAGDPPGT